MVIYVIRRASGCYQQHLGMGWGGGGGAKQHEVNLQESKGVLNGLVQWLECLIID